MLTDMGLPWLHWFLIGELAFISIVQVLIIGKKREPLTSGQVAFHLLVNIALVMALVFFK